MSSPTETNASQTPATGTKRRYLGATRRKRAAEISLFSPSSVSQLRHDVQQQHAKPIERCTEEGPCSEIEDNIDLEQGENGNTRKRACLQLEADSNSQTPANNSTKSRLFTQSDKSQTEVDNDVDGKEMTRSSSSSLSSLHSTPIHRLPTRHSLGSAKKRLKHNSFKSPVRVQADSSKPTESVESLTKEVEKLQQTAEELQAEIASLTNEGYCEKELHTHIEKMHEYNDLKDTGQMLLGKIALVEGVTTKDLYERFGLNLDD